MKIIKKLLLLIALPMMAVGFGVLLATPIFADGEPAFNETYLLNRTLAVNVMKCYDGGHMVQTVTLGDKPTAYKVSDLANNDGEKVAVFPTDFVASIDSLNCKQLIGGKGGYKGILSVNNIKDELANGTQETQGPFLEKFGYKSTGSTDEMQCGRLGFTGERYYEDGTLSGGSSGFSIKTAAVCARVDSNGNLKDGSLELDGDVEGLPSGLKNSPIVLTSDAGGGIYVNTTGELGVSAPVVCSAGENFNSCLEKIVNLIKTTPLQSEVYEFEGKRYYLQYNYSNTTTSSKKGIANEFKLGSGAAEIAAENLLGRKNTTFLDEEIRSLYQIYLNKSNAHIICGVPDDKQADFVNSGYNSKVVKLVKDGKTLENCLVSTTDKNYNGFTSDRKWSQKVSLDEILDFLATGSVASSWASDIVSIENVELYGEDDDKEGGGLVTDVEDTDEVNCFNSAGALGWIVCPIISFVQSTVTAIYEGIITNFLEFRASNLEISSDNGTYRAWQTFQIFANIIFVIVFLIVIFSQVTGIGIDNLGIKRVLPKLIIAAILINLSYIICMLAVDISNILGVSLNNLFANITVTAQSSPGSTASAVLGTIFTTAVGSAVGGLVAFSSPLWGPVVVIPLLLGLITALIGVLFFFILLGARQAGIIILIVISPVAFACYMLPNTKSLFDRWFKMLEGLLLLYPICGLLMGGSAFASDVLMTIDTGFLGKLIAMLVGVVPFFFIPTLLRGAFAAMGNLGARISGFGQGMSRRLTGAIGRSEAAKDWQTRLNAGLDRNGNMTRLGQRRADIASGRSIFSRVPGMKNAASRAQARGLVSYEKMQDELDFASRPDLIRSEAEARRFGRRQAAEDAALVNSGVANRTGDLKGFDAATSEFEEGTLSYAYMQAVNAGNVEAQYAIEERMAASGHHGAEAMRQVMEKLQYNAQNGINAKASAQGIENMAKAAKNGRHIGDIKSGTRSTFDYINAVTEGKVLEKDSEGHVTGNINSGQTLGSYVDSVNFSKMSEAQLFNTDDEELTRWKSYVSNKRTAIANAESQMEQDLGHPLSAEEKQKAYASAFSSDTERKNYEALVSQAEKASQNERLLGQAKESRQNLVADIAGVPENQRRSSRLDVPRSGGDSNADNSAPKPMPQRQRMSDNDLVRLHRLYSNKVKQGVSTPGEEALYNKTSEEIARRKADGQPHPDLA